MPAVKYVVTSTMKSHDVVEEFVSWLTGGHVQALLAAGASSATIAHIDSEIGGTFIVEVEYIFPSRESLESYFAGPAIPLRQEGKELFVDTGKCVLSRRIGDVVFELSQ
jgi:hypothetical protein